jgi:hypothetical protein
MRITTAGELDCLAVLWQAAENGITAMRLSQIRSEIIKKRQQMGEDAPALTTVSTYLRGALHKGLLEEVRLNGDDIASPTSTHSARGALRGTRSPHTAYRARVGPTEVFRGTLQAIVEVYPHAKRLLLLADVADVLDLPTKVRSEIRRWIDRQQARAGGGRPMAEAHAGDAHGTIERAGATN